MTKKLLNRRTFIASSAGATLAMPFLSRTAFSQSAYAGKDYLVTLPDTTNEKLVIEHVAPLMKERFGVNLKTQSSASGKTLSTMRVQRRNPPALVATLDMSYALQAHEEGLIDDVTEELVPNLADVRPQARIQDGKIVSFIISIDTLVYNKNRWSTPITSYADIFAPDMIATSAIASPSTQNGLEFIAGAAAVATGKPISEAMYNLEAGIEYLGQFRDKIGVVFGRAQEVMPMLASGEINSCFVKARFLAEWLALDAPVGAVIPKEGAFYSLNCLVPVKGTNATEVAMGYIDIMLSPEIQALFPSAIGSAAVNTKAVADVPEKLKTIVPSVEDIEKLSLLPILDQAKMESLNTLFNHVVGK
ncbi:hypothetical protein ACO34A_00600 [Rhizobium sp. ACO-34A]|nr:extracellular solute-binding protein [Rhizobium sp. ACO-34A]ATN32312.1 hypothetical protein ACO34A_00600 [Rhizobium sp. ACO-34A]